MHLHCPRGIFSFLIIWLPLCFFASPPALAHHGPGTTGGALSTETGETLNPGAFSLGLSWTYTQFESLTNREILRRTSRVGGDDPDFDAIRWSLLQSAELSYGVFEDFQLSASLGWYRGEDVREGHFNDLGQPEIAEAGSVSGMTDMWLGAKYRVLKGPHGHWALFGGVKLPLGRDDVRSDGGTERLEPSLQPGSGAFDFLFGTAYSVWLTTRLTLDTSAQYTLRTENDNFKIGDRVEGGVALAYRLVEDIATYPQPSLFVEANVVHLFKNEQNGEKTRNSGGSYIFLAPGIRLGISQHVSFSVSPRFPALQALNGEQQETLFKVVAALTFSL